MSPFGWHPPHLVDNTDTLYLGDQIDNRQCWFFKIFLCFCANSLPSCQSVFFVFVQSVLKYFKTLYNLNNSALYGNFSLGLELKKVQISILIPNIRRNWCGK